MYRIDDELKEFLESGVALLLGTASNDGIPHSTYVWGMRVADDRTSGSIYLERARSSDAVADLEANRMVAVTAASPVSYRSVQLKGHFSERTEATAADNAWVERHRDAFLVETSLVGDPPRSIRNLWMDDLIRLDFNVERAFDQTPGPNAGREL